MKSEQPRRKHTTFRTRRKFEIKKKCLVSDPRYLNTRQTTVYSEVLLLLLLLVIVIIIIILIIIIIISNTYYNYD
jgi:hypothetical protein